MATKRLSKEGHQFIRQFLEETQPLYDEYMEHLRQTDPEKYARFRDEAARLGVEH